MTVADDKPEGNELAESGEPRGGEALSRVIEVTDQHGQKHKHSATTRKCCLQVYGMPFQQMSLDLKIATRVSEVKEMLGNMCNVDPEKLYFFIKEGKYFRCQREAEEMRPQTFVKGITNFKRDFVTEIERNAKIPAWDTLPFKLRKNFPPPPPKTPTVRVYIFYGSADSFAQWAHFYSIMPAWVDVVVHEWPGHGQRKDETTPTDVDGLADDAMDGLKDAFAEHAEGGLAANTPFVFAGHSIGALLLVGVAERLRAKHNIDPWSVIILDRAAPHVPMCSDFGREMMRNDPEQFNMVCNPMTKKMGDSEEERRAFRMWMNEIMLQEDTKPKGDHIFQCPVHVAVGTRNYYWDIPEVQAGLSEEEKKSLKERDAIYASKPGSQAMFDRSTFDEWRDWTDFECKVYDLDTDHFGIKMNEHFIWFLLETLGALKKAGRPKKPGADAEPPAAPAAAA